MIADPLSLTPSDLASRASRGLYRLARRRTATELALCAAVLADPTRGYLCARAAGVTWRHFGEPDCLCLWFACERCRFKPLPEVLGYAAKCLQAGGYWDGSAEANARPVLRGRFRGLRWHWGALAGTATAAAYSVDRVRRLAGQLAELDRRQRESERGLAYACRVLAGESAKGEARENETRVQRPARRVVA